MPQKGKSASKDARSKGSPDLASAGGKSSATEGNLSGGLSKSKQKAGQRYVRDVLHWCEVLKDKTMNIPPEPGKHQTITFDEFRSIYESIEHVRQLEKKRIEQHSRENVDEPFLREDQPSTSDEKQKRIDDFMRWCEEMGIDVNEGIKLHDFGIPFGIGLLATRDIKAGEKLFSVPRSAMLTAETALKAPLGKILDGDPVYSQIEPVRVALHLLEEKLNSESKWAPYIAMLPKCHFSMLEMNIEEVELMNGSTAQDEGMKLYRNIARQFAYYKRFFMTRDSVQYMKISEFFTFDFYRWAVSAVTTRQNRVPIAQPNGEDVSMMTAMIPFLDFANHHENEPTPSSTLDGCECITEKDIAAGEQVFIRYGEREIWQTLAHNGYVDGCRIFDEILPTRKFRTVIDRHAFEVEFNDKDMAVRRAKVATLEKFLQAFPPRLSVTGSVPYFDRDFLAYSRLAVASEEFMKKVKEEDLVKFTLRNVEADPDWTRLCWEATTWTCVRVAKDLKAFPMTTEKLLEMLKSEISREVDSNDVEAARKKNFRVMALTETTTERLVLEHIRPWLMSEMKRLADMVEKLESKAKSTVEQKKKGKTGGEGEPTLADSQPEGRKGEEKKAVEEEGPPSPPNSPVEDEDKQDAEAKSEKKKRKKKKKKGDQGNSKASEVEDETEQPVENVQIKDSGEEKPPADQKQKEELESSVKPNQQKKKKATKSRPSESALEKETPAKANNSAREKKLESASNLQSSTNAENGKQEAEDEWQDVSRKKAKKKKRASEESHGSDASQPREKTDATDSPPEVHQIRKEVAEERKIAEDTQPIVSNVEKQNNAEEKRKNSEKREKKKKTESKPVPAEASVPPQKADKEETTVSEDGAKNPEPPKQEPVEDWTVVSKKKTKTKKNSGGNPFGDKENLLVGTNETVAA